MAEITEQDQRTKIAGFLNGYKAIYLLNIGAELGILQALGDSEKGLTSAEISLKLDLHEPYVKIWCQTAYHFEMVDCDDQDRFLLQQFMDGLIVDEQKPMNMVGVLDLAVNVTGERLRKSIDYYRTGTTMDDYSPERSRVVAKATNGIPPLLVNIISSLPEMVPIKQLLSDGCKFLDVGCGAGEVIVQFAQSFPKSTFIGVDPISHSTKLGTDKVSELGLESRVSLQQMGGQEIPLVNEIDVVGMVLTLHELPPDIRTAVVEKSYQALADTGKLLVFDFSYPESLIDFRNPDYAPAVMDQFDETVLGVNHLTDNQVDEMFTNIGFTDIQRPMRLPGFVITTASK